MLDKYSIIKILGLIKPFDIKQIKAKLCLFQKCIFSQNSRIYNCAFEGFNLIQDSAVCNSCYLGKCTYIGYKSNLFKTKTGRFFSIADNIRTGFGTHPTNVFVSTFPSFYYATKNLPISFMRGGIFNIWRYVDKKQKYLVEIGNDVWIGSNVLIMDGVKICDGAIVAAAVVTKDVEPFSICRRSAS